MNDLDVNYSDIYGGNSLVISTKRFGKNWNLK